jgi:predicted acetyltransferase
VRLRPLTDDDEAPFLAAHRELLADGFTFALGYHDSMSWGRYRHRLAAASHGRDLEPGQVASTFLVADVGGTIVGRTSIRHELNAFLAHEGGHIGYGVVPAHRRRGYATEILRQSLDVARFLGVEQVLLTCDEANVGSATVIERCGGVLESVVTAAGGNQLRRYWIG